MKPTWAYIAGFLDGEGSIIVSKEKDRKSPHLCVSFSNTNYEVLEAVQKVIGGRIYADHRNPQRWKTGYALHVRREAEIETLLLKTSRHLIIKKEKAKTMLKIIRLKLKLNVMKTVMRTVKALKLDCNNRT